MVSSHLSGLPSPLIIISSIWPSISNIYQILVSSHLPGNWHSVSFNIYWYHPIYLVLHLLKHLLVVSFYLFGTPVPTIRSVSSTYYLQCGCPLVYLVHHLLRYLLESTHLSGIPSPLIRISGIDIISPLSGIPCPRQNNKCQVYWYSLSSHLVARHITNLFLHLIITRNTNQVQYNILPVVYQVPGNNQYQRSNYDYYDTPLKRKGTAVDLPT